jgi:hypothetical protein
MKEIWKDVPWYENNYQASNLWNIKNIKFKQERILKKYRNNNWYFTISLKWKTKLVHRIILNSFLWESLYECNHKDWDKSNNNVNNLEWCTHSENIKHRSDVLWYKSSFEINHPFIWLKWADSPNSKKVSQYSLDW